MNPASVFQESDSNFHIDCIDVGHGSAIVIANGSRATMIDTGPGGPILEYLRTAGIKEIDTVILSHADQDHIAGLVAMLDAGFRVRQIVLNADSAKKSKLWKSLVYSLDAIKRTGATTSIIEAIEEVKIQTVSERAYLEVLAPRLRIAKLGSGSDDLEGNALETNTMSVVVMIRVDNRPLLLFTGDIDATGCDHLFDSGVSLEADYLVLPHHGGLMGSAVRTRAAIRDLCEKVSPKQIFISNGRSRYDNPQRIVISEIRKILPTIPIACAQLSTRCSANGGPAEQSEVTPFSQGRSQGFSCAGSIRLTDSDGITSLRDNSAHAAYLDAHAPTALCRQN